MRFFSYLSFCFLLFLHQSFIFTQVAKGHEDWSAVEVRSFSEALKAAGVSDESISILIEATSYSQIQKISSFFQNLEVGQQESENTAANEFSYYVFNRQNIDVDAIMGGDWVDKLIENTQDWTPIEAEYFISFLKSEKLEIDNILMILKATDYLRVIRAGQITFILEEETTPSEATQTHRQTEEVVSHAQRGSDVFIHFAREQFRRELEEKGKFLEGEEFEAAFKKGMGNKGKWEQKIVENTTTNSKWTIRDAQDFLSFLREKVGGHATLRAVKTTSFFSNTSYESFQLRFDIFSEYVDAERMTKQLQDCLTCFTKGTAHVIRSVIETIKEYFEQEGEGIVEEALNNNIKVFSLSENQSKLLEELLPFLESYIGKEGVKDIILNKPASFAIFRVKKDPNSKMYTLQMPLVVAYIESYFESAEAGKAVVQEIMKNSFTGLAMAEVKKLKDVVGYIEVYAGKAVVQEIMKNSFQGLAVAEVKKLKDVVGYIEVYAGKEVVQEIMKNSFKGLAVAEVKKLEDVVGYIEVYAGKEVVQEIMKNSFYGLALAEVKKLEDVVGYIEGYFEDEKAGQKIVQKIMKNSFYGLAMAEVEKLKDVVGYIEGYAGKEVVQAIMKKSFYGLALAEVKKLEDVVGYIEGYADKAVVQEIMKNSFQGLALAEVEKLKDVVGYIEGYFENKEAGQKAVQELMKNSFYGLALAEVKKLEDVVGYIEGYAGKAVVQEIMQKSFYGLALAEVKKLEDVVKYIEGYFEDEKAGQKIVQKIMKNSFYGLAVAEVEKLKDVVGYIEGYAGKEVVQELMKNSFKGLALAEVKKLEAVLGYIEVYAGKEVVQEIMKKSFKGLALAEVKKLEAVVEYIEVYAGKAVVQEIMKNSFQGLAIAEVKKLKDVVGYIEKYIEAESEKETAIKQIMTFVNLFSQDSYFDESKTNSFIFDKLNDLLKSIDESIESEKYDMKARERWKARLRDIFLEFSIEELQGLHQDINENTCGGALS